MGSSDPLPARPASREGLHLSPTRLAGFLLGLALTASAAEVLLRTRADATSGYAASTLTLARGNPLHPDRGIFQLDPRLGFRPVPGSSRYNELGVLWNEYSLEKDPARERVLFLGDSVVARGTLVSAIRELYHDDAYEWWNAGVDAYSTIQEVDYYREQLAGLNADHVVLVFNWTDYEVTPLMTLDADGNVLVMNARRTGLNPWLLRHSHVYRYYAGHLLGKPPPGGADVTLIRAAEQKIAELKRLTRARGAKLTVLVTPALRSVSVWPRAAKRNYERTLATLTRLGIDHYDALPELKELIAGGREPAEPPGDLMHPSQELCRRFAARLRRAGFLGDR